MDKRLESSIPMIAACVSIPFLDGLYRNTYRFSVASVGCVASASAGAAAAEDLCKLCSC